MTLKTLGFLLEDQTREVHGATVTELVSINPDTGTNSRQ
jgi:hypothetical protein